MQHPTTCKNCSNHFKGKFCNNCGQKANVGTISLKEIFHEGWHNITHTDKGYLQLVWDMMARPGATMKNYLSGQRKKYFSPFTFYLVTTSLLILVTHWVFKKEDSLLKLHNEIGNYIGQKINYVLFLAIPIISLVLWLFYKRHFKNFAEALTVMIFSYGALNFILICWNILFYIFIEYHYTGSSYVTLFSYLYVLYVLHDFFRPRGFFAFLKLFLLIISFYILVEIVVKDLILLEYGVPFNQLFE